MVKMGIQEKLVPQDNEKRTYLSPFAILGQKKKEDKLLWLPLWC